MTVKVNELEKLFAATIAKLRSDGLEEVDIDVDFYWDIPMERIYNPYEQPSDLTLGQLSDDWTELLRLLYSKDEIIAYDIQRISNILKAISKAPKVI